MDTKRLPPLPALLPALALACSMALTTLASPASAQGAGVWRGDNAGRPVVPDPQVRLPRVQPQAIQAQRRVSPRAQLRAQLSRRRAVNLARFVAYREAGEFPHNHVREGMLNVFIDDEGHICAAANLMAQDGLLPLVRQTAARDNFLRLVTVGDGPLYRWMLASGFTQAEIDMIQEPYDFIGEEPFVEPPPQQQNLENMERLRLQTRFREIEQVLLTNAQRSLDQAVDTLMAYRRANGVPASAPLVATGDVLPSPVPAPIPVHHVQPVVVQPVQARPVRPTNDAVYVSSVTTVRDPLVWAPHMRTAD